MSYLSTNEDFERIFMTSTEFVDQFVGSSAYTWGSNGSGQLGDGTTTSRSSPGVIAGAGTNWKQVAGGGDYSAAIKTDGTLWTWGSNGSGTLGDGTTTNRSSPVTTAGGGTNWKQVAGSIYKGSHDGSYSNGSHTSAIKTDGTLWTWGLNYSGQLGDGTTSSRLSPVTTAGGGTNWKQVSMGYEYTHAIKTDGTLWTWGYGFYGQLGDGARSNRSSPVTVIGDMITTLYDTSSYQTRMTFLGSPAFAANTPLSGSLYFGVQASQDYLNVPTSSNLLATGDFTLECWVKVPANSVNSGVDPLSAWARIYSGPSDSIILRSSQGGQPAFCFIGPGGTIASSVASNDNKWHHVAATRSGSTVKFFVDGFEIGSFTSSSTYDFGSAGSARIGDQYTYNPSANDWFSGNLTNLRLVIGTAVYTSTFARPLEPLTSISGTQLLLNARPREPFLDSSPNNFTLTQHGSTLSANAVTVFTNSGSMKGNSGYLITPSSSNYILNGDFTLEYWFFSTATGATFDDQFTVGVGGTAVIIVRLNSTDSIYLNGTFGYVPDLLTLCPGNTWNHLAISRTGTTLKIFVNGTQRYTGTNTTTFNSTGAPIQLFGCIDDGGRTFPGYISNFRIIKGAGLYSSNFTPSIVPLTAVPNTVFLFTGTPFYVDTKWKQVSAGGAHTVAIKTDGTLWTWGSNGTGCLGTGGLTDRSSPDTTVAGSNNWKQVACGDSHVAAIKTDGTLWTWGSNGSGRLGDGTTNTRLSPVTTVTGGTNWKQVSASVDFTSATKTDGTLWTWGFNTSGQLGDGTTSSRLSPAQLINNLSNWKQIGCGATHVVAVAQT